MDPSQGTPATFVSPLNYYEKLAVNSKKGVELLQQAYNTGDLPTRKAHIGIAFKSVGYEPVALIGNIVISILCPVATILLYPISLHDRAIFKFVAIEIMALTPARFIVAAASCVVRIIAAAVGIFHPKTAAWLWIKTQQMKGLSYRVDAALYKYFVPLKPVDPAAKTTAFSKINPNEILGYLSREKALFLENSLKPDQLRMEQEEELRSAYNAFRDELNRIPLIAQKIGEMATGTDVQPLLSLNALTATERVKVYKFIRSSKNTLSFYKFFTQANNPERAEAYKRFKQIDHEPMIKAFLKRYEFGVVISETRDVDPLKEI